ncbi:MAG: hypothetical protein EOO52_01905 [Gammaproteobacteria bacterium]|nr:MAG: hypothetical protein EOO52_01905 [Gammaproteobacteria bacterium]
MNAKNCELRYLDRDRLLQQGISVPLVQPYSFVGDTYPAIDNEMRNGLDVKTERGSPVFKVESIFEEDKEGQLITVVELKFDRVDPTPYFKNHPGHDNNNL